MFVRLIEVPKSDSFTALAAWLKHLKIAVELCYFNYFKIYRL